jgi:hypothetical protein
MPHYKDGTLAKDGDVVKGKPYNTPREVIGVIAAINPGVDTCNCLVFFPEMVDVNQVASYESARLIIGHDGVPKAYVLKSDYGEVRAFEKIF